MAAKISLCPSKTASGLVWEASYLTCLISLTFMSYCALCRINSAGMSKEILNASIVTLTACIMQPNFLSKRKKILMSYLESTCFGTASTYKFIEQKTRITNSNADI